MDSHDGITVRKRRRRAPTKMTMALLNKTKQKLLKIRNAVAADCFPKSKANDLNMSYQKMRRMLPMALNVLLAIEAERWLMVHRLLDHWLEHCCLQPAEGEKTEKCTSISH